MRKPNTIEYLYLDFDGFFASVEEQVNPALHGKPVGVVPFAGTAATGLIAANAMAKRMGVKMGMRVPEARQACPGLKVVPQSPALYEEVHQKLLLLIEEEIPISTVCSIDELLCRLDPHDIANPIGLSERIKARIKTGIGAYITCSIGMAPNGQLAKIAGEINKPDGLMILRPEDLPGPLLALPLEALPGIGGRMKRRLFDAGLWSVEALWNSSPKQMRALWGNVMGERMWYALHGYALQGEETERRMFGHGRVLPPTWRNLPKATEAARLLSIKAARRLRRGGYTACKFGFHLKLVDGKRWFAEHYMGEVQDDRTILAALYALSDKAEKALSPYMKILNVSVSLYGLSRAGAEQNDMFLGGDPMSNRWSALTGVMDSINGKYGRTAISMGPWPEIPGGYAGGKIAFGRIPEMEDFW